MVEINKAYYVNLENKLFNIHFGHNRCKCASNKPDTIFINSSCRCRPSFYAISNPDNYRQCDLAYVSRMVSNYILNHYKETGEDLSVLLDNMGDYADDILRILQPDVIEQSFKTRDIFAEELRKYFKIKLTEERLF